MPSQHHAHIEHTKALQGLDTDPTVLADDLQETDSESDFLKDNWDPHAGTKPSPLDGEASDKHWDSGDDMEEAESECNGHYNRKPDLGK